ncbi:MAG: hypothetical protein LBG11_10260 [Bifidobacteriaceae bacterium]|nr:hypothetical protein [Bifidobacteriaceae bacterium]
MERRLLIEELATDYAASEQAQEDPPASNRKRLTSINDAVLISFSLS